MYHMKRHCLYGNYKRHREAGIQSLCWKLLKTGDNKQEIFHAAHKFSRYSKIKMTEKIAEEGISRDPTEYEIDYKYIHVNICG